MSGALPTTVVLSDSHAMIEGRNLSSVDDVQIVARVAFGGVEIGDLRQGKWRFLDRPEVARLHAAAGSTPERSTDSMEVEA